LINLKGGFLMSLTRNKTVWTMLLWVGVGVSSLFGATIDSSTREHQRETSAKGQGGEQVISEVTSSNLPGNRMVNGRIKGIRGDQMEIDIGNPQSLFVPLKPAMDKGQTFKPGDAIVVTMNDHNAVVDYHHPNEPSHHLVVRGKLSTPLTVGLDKAVIETDEGTKTFLVADRAKGKLTAIPIGVDAFFMMDESGRLVDAQLASAEGVRESARNNKARIKGAHEQVRAIFRGQSGEDRLKIVERGREREVPFRPPLKKMDRLQPGQEVVLLMDDQGYVLEIAAPNLAPAP
jgi:hypothetical protein